MKHLKQIREEFDTIIGRRRIEESKYGNLVDAGLLDARQLSLLENALDKDSRAMTLAERNMVVDLLDSLMSQFDFNIQEAAPRRSDPKSIPTILVLRRKAVRSYPKSTDVALYYAPAIDKYVSIPFGPDATVTALAESVDLIGSLRKLNNEAKPKTDGDIGNARPQTPLVQSRPSSNPQMGAQSKTGALMSKGTRQSRINQVTQANQAATEARKKERLEKINKGAQEAIRHTDPNKENNVRSDRSVSDVAKDPNTYLKAAGAFGTIFGGAAALKGVGAAAKLVGAAGGVGAIANKVKDYIRGTAPGAGGGSQPFNRNSKVNMTTQARLGQHTTQASNRTSIDARTQLAYNRALREDFVNIMLGDNEVVINKEVAKKTVDVFESLNKKNQQKMLKMLSESDESYQKVIDFITRH